MDENFSKNYHEKQAKVFIKMESLFLSFIEDNFLSYLFYKYPMPTGFYNLFLFFYDFQQFQHNIIDEINCSDFLYTLYNNYPLLDHLKHLQNQGYPLILVSNHHQELVEMIRIFFHLDDSLGNEDGCYHSVGHLIEKNYNKNIIASSIFVTDNLDFDISFKFKKIITTGSLFKIFFNCLFHKKVTIIRSSNTFNQWIYQWLSAIKSKKKSSWYYFPLMIMIPMVEMAIIIRVFFFNLFFVMMGLFLLGFFLFPKIFLLRYLFPIIMDTNNFINIYNIINAFWPKGCPSTKNYYIQEGILKSFGSLLIGIFIFSLVNFLYFNSKFSLAVQLIYIIIFLKYPLFSLEDVKYYKVFLYFFNILLFYFFI
jgi:hypothetical protein